MNYFKGIIFCCSLSFVIGDRSSAQIPEACFQNNIINAGNPIDAYWSMDGNGNDLLAPANNPQGSLGAGVTFTGSSFAGTGAASFAGTGGIQYSDGTFMNSAVTNLSFGAWIKPTNVSGGGNQIIFEEGGSSGFTVYLSNTGLIVFVVADGSQANSNSISYTFPTDGQYHHVAFTYENGRLTSYLDGKFVQYLASGFSGIAAHTDAGGLGATFGTTSAARVRFSSTTFVFYNGLIDEAFYTRSLISPGNMLQYGRCHNKYVFNNLACNPDAFMVQTASSIWISINLVTGVSTPATGGTDDGYTPAGTSLNAIGYNSLDGTIYGIDAQSGLLIQVEVTPTPSGYTYNATRIAYIPSLDGDNTLVGDVYGGKLYLRSGNSGIATHYIVDVNPASATYLQLISTVTESGSFQCSDWAVNPVDRFLYSVSANGSLMKIDPTFGTVTNLGSVGLGTTSTYGAAYFDNAGFLYIYNNTSGKTYRVEVAGASKTGVLFATARGNLSLNDGARCADAPFPIDFGDAPDASTNTAGAGTGIGQYNTMLSNDGPRHLVNPFIPLRLGATVTLENDAKPSTAANTDADDGISSFPVLSGGLVPQVIPSYSVNTSVTNANTGTAATLYAWIDWNNNGIFETAERASAVVPANTANATITVSWSNMTLSGVSGTPGTYARFRLSTDVNAQNPTGAAADGEVEDYYIPFATPLPVQLTSFTISEQTKCDVDVIWTTAMEENINYYSIERSSDAINFSAIGTVYAKGSNSAYRFVDINPSEHSNFYRLNIAERTGQNSYSPTKEINLNCDSRITVWPNPVHNQLNINGLKSDQTIEIADILGCILLRSSATRSTYHVDLSALPANTYYIHIRAAAGNMLQTFKISKF